MRDYTEEELKMLSDVLPNIALQLRTSLSTIYMAVRSVFGSFSRVSCGAMRSTAM